jgi:Taurine catabolism dioxygenase TauD, TfdA family
MRVSGPLDPRAWCADTVDPPASWYVHLSENSLAALENFEREHRNYPKTVTDVRVPDWLAARCAEDISRARCALETGRGYTIIVAGPPGRFRPESLTLYYWLIGEMLGRPNEQNLQGTLLYDVRDTGQDVRYGARFSVTNAESSFHTDNSFGAEVLDYVGLLCLNTAKSGGKSQIVSGITVERQLHAKHSDAWNVLRQPFHVDRRGGLKPGDEPTIQFPVFHGDGADLVIRYLRYWIEVGHEKAAAPLSPQQIEALNLLDRVAGDPRMRVEFSLQPGDMLWVNNRWILHNRTAFEDHDEPERRRHYVRLWVQRAD